MRCRAGRRERANAAGLGAPRPCGAVKDLPGRGRARWPVATRPPTPRTLLRGQVTSPSGSCACAVHRHEGCGDQGLRFRFFKKNSVTTGNGIPAEISRFSGNFDWKEFSNLKFRNFGIPAGFSVHLAGFSVLFTEK